MNSVTVLHPGKLFALQNVIALNGRVGHYPIGARGFASCNCYLLREDDSALLLDTGFTVHESAIIAQLESLIGQSIPLSFITLRTNDFLSVCNAMAIAKQFKIEQCYALTRGMAAQLDFHSQTAEAAAAAAARLPLTLITGNEWQQVGHTGRRPVKFYQSPLRLISTRWVYDQLTRTLFTSDMFAHSWADRPEGPWIIEAGDDHITEEDVRAFLLSTRFWWLEGAKTDELRRRLAQIFEQCDIETIAPGYGKILSGSEVVARHYRLLDEVLRKLDRGITPPRYVARNEEHYG